MKKKHKLVFGPMVVGLCALPAHQCLAQFDAFLKIDGIQGESADSKHRYEIDIVSFEHGVPQPASGVPNFKFSMQLNKASPYLYACCAGSSNLSYMTFTLRSSGKELLEYMNYKIEDATITSVQSAGGPASTVPADEFTVKFQKITWTYRPRNADGTIGTPIVTSWSSSIGKLP